MYDSMARIVISGHTPQNLTELLLQLAANGRLIICVVACIGSNKA